ncbi:F-box/FBD/LRR-repeat-like protein isoform X1 [Cinnamomum micranthum f. kanehirae]|uniref:F-box/FBD/LRR-repeat-like protein isoform X1 n=1 Tax=Cinnamomum micranthum f. kanehirae TaxID=337451 RepID=A0A3S3P6H3_9MAGN|nr:F-box/FBD/LRR-repeat-like protein isoform X1 [Cinnamomum micranthum f. kanehirae]
MKKTKRQAFGVGAAGAGGVDFISNLPEDVMSSILALVPLRDAVRTSILSKEWRYKWVSIPDVVFNRDRLMKSSSSYSYSSSDDDERDGEDACAHVVDQVVSQLIGPISKFSCVFFSFLSSHHFDRWIGFLSKNHGNGIKEFVFAIERKINWYNVPHSVFHYQELCHLELLNCILELPPTFKGFRNLSVLNLAAKISKDDIECLISECPLLEWLKLIAFDFYQCLNIYAPNLRYLELDGEFRDVSIEACPLLTDVSLLSDIDPPWGRSGFGPSSHIPFIGCLQGIKSLKLKQFYLQYLCVGIVPKKLPATLDHLQYLEVQLQFNSKEILAILCILRSSPNLKQLKIKYRVDSKGKRDGLLREKDDISVVQAELCGVKTQSDCFLSHLHAVEIFGIAMLSDLKFIRCILSNAPVLETMDIYTNRHVEAEKVLKILDELLPSQQASTQAEIIYLGHYKESQWEHMIKFKDPRKTPTMIKRRL